MGGFAAGSTVVVRGIMDEAFQTGGICDVKPLIVVADDDDHQLDVLVDQDRSWRWKDEADLARAVDIGQFTVEEAPAVRDAGEDAIAVLEAAP